MPMNPEKMEANSDIVYIQSVWEEQIETQVADKNLARAVFDATMAEYAGEDRYYHDVSHIASCIKKLEPYRGREDYQKLFLALLWHDVVYDTSKIDNEESSAKLAVAFMDVLGLEGADDVSRMIVTTKEHTSDKEDEQLICDIDMSILAEPLPVYLAYTKGIREEFRKIAPKDGDFYNGRLNFLYTLPSDQTIFRHPDFKHLNEAANMNVRHEKALLAGKL